MNGELIEGGRLHMHVYPQMSKHTWVHISNAHRLSVTWLIVSLAMLVAIQKQASPAHREFKADWKTGCGGAWQ